MKKLRFSFGLLACLALVSLGIMAFKQTAPQTAPKTATPVAQVSTTPQVVENIKFMTWEEAQLAVQKEPRKVFVDVFTPWCGPCKIYGQRMQDPQIANYLNEKFYCIKFNGESGDTVSFGGKTYTNPKYVAGAFRNSAHELTTALSVQAYPTTLVFDENLVLIQQLTGAFDKLTLDQILHFFGEDKYKTQKWEDFQKEYKSPFAVSEP